VTGWDDGLDYNATYLRIVRHLKLSLSSPRNYRKRVPAPCYDAILLIQLKNASRISEAVRAFREYLRTQRAELEVLVSKKRRKEYRKMVIPQEVQDMDMSLCLGLLDRPEEKVIDVAKHYARKTYSFKTHSLRYARITHLLKQGVNPSIVAKITRHSKLDFILRYTQEKAAEEILRSME